MIAKRLLMACPNYWHSPFQVGSHHLARFFLHAGWQVAFVSDPISPFHLLGGWSSDLERRFDIWRTDGCHEHANQLWTYLPLAFLTPHRWPILRSRKVHHSWQNWTWPNVVERVKQQGFGSVDLLYIDSINQSFWLDALEYRQAIYRLTDYSPFFDKYTQTSRELEVAMARRVDLVVYPSPQLAGYVQHLRPRRNLCLPNGVEFDHFASPQSQPPEYRTLSGPIAVYVGVIHDWFRFDWVRQAAQRLPGTSFVLIGQDELARRHLAGLPNVHIFGCRDYEVVPAYLQHADVGLIPFNGEQNPAAVECLNPLKLYQYLASGLPVVASDWEALRQLNTPATRCSSADEFVEAIRTATSQRSDGAAHREFAAQHDWRFRVRHLLETLETLPGNGGCSRVA